MTVLNRLLGETGGATAVEFAIAAPLLLFGLIAMIDTGIMATSRMEMDRNVRAGAQAAMSLNNDPTAIETIVLASAGDPVDMAVSATMVCACIGTAASCTTLCGSGEAPSVYFDIAAERPYAGLLGNRTVRTQSRVQIR